MRLSRNFGTEGGLTAALARRGDAAIIIDHDLQDPPEYIPAFLERWEEGYQNVYAIVARRTGESPFRRFCARGYYRIVNRLSDTPAPRNVSDFRLVDRAAYETYLRLPERYRMVRFMWPWIGFRSIGIETERPARGGGSSTFRFVGMFRSAFQSILAQSRAPLTIIPTFGMLLAALSFAMLAVAVFRAFVFGVPFDGYGTIISINLMLFGFLFLFLGMLSEYIGLISKRSGTVRRNRRKHARARRRTRPGAGAQVTSPISSHVRSKTSSKKPRRTEPWPGSVAAWFGSGERVISETDRELMLATVGARWQALRGRSVFVTGGTGFVGT